MISPLMRTAPRCATAESYRIVTSAASPPGSIFGQMRFRISSNVSGRATSRAGAENGAVAREQNGAVPGPEALVAAVRDRHRRAALDGDALQASVDSEQQGPSVGRERGILPALG